MEVGEDPIWHIFLFQKMIKNNQKIIFFNKGKGARDMTHVSDIDRDQFVYL